eukprot:GHVU01228682.1.p2 GENE.GHVU01228682.1~~GHVU01228682.1.p2  ORF type:complete len:132 (-),score=25.00 GHVU01228682.1:94-489(-)
MMGLKSEVTVHRDRHGIPYIYADNEEDAFFMQGYLHGTERPWQLTFLKHVCRGRLAELVGGKEALQVDMGVRAMRFFETATVDVERTRGSRIYTVTAAYASGIRKGLSSLPRQPLEATLLGMEIPTDWTRE